MLEAKKRANTAIRAVHKTNNALILDTETGTIKVEPFTEGIIRVVYTEAEHFSQAPHPGTLGRTEDCKWSHAEEHSTITITTEKIRLVIQKSTCSFSYFNKNGDLLTKEPDEGGKTLIPYQAYKIVRDENSLVEKIETPDGIKEVVINANREFYKKLNHTRLDFEWQEGEALYGLGQQEEGSLNLRGTRQYIHQANMKIAIPFMISTRGYGILLDTYSPLIFSDTEYGSYLYNEAADELDFYFIAGDDFDEIISGYRKLTGKAVMLPEWAFGYIQSQERYETQQEILNTVAEYLRRNIPLSCIVLDWQSWESGMWGQKTFDQSRFPDPEHMIEELHKNGVHFMISVWPNMFADTDNYRQLKNMNALFPYSEIYNAFNSEARLAYWKQAFEGLFSHGIDAWWCDCSEPFTPEWNSLQKPEPDQNYMAFHDTARNYIDEEYTNAYALMHARTIYEGQRKATSEKRVVNLTRSGYTGQQRYGTILWSGDISANWHTLRSQISAGLNLCASGLPYWTLDIGAFFVKKGDMWFWNGDYENGCDDLGYRELYTRWLQFGTFLPMFRAHGTDTRREVWNFGEPGEMFYEIIVRYINMRYQLLPYIYSMAGMVTQKNYTIMRLLAFNFRYDQNTFDIKDQYMFGDALMICPVTEAMYYTSGSEPLEGIEKTRKVYLPSGQDWYDFWTNQKYEGGRTIQAAAELEHMPVFVKSGSIIPQAVIDRNSGKSTDSSIRLAVYSGSDGCFTIYQDEKNNYNYENGDFSIIEITWNDSERVLIIGNREGTFTGIEKEITFYVEIDGKKKTTATYSGSEISIRL